MSNSKELEVKVEAALQVFRSIEGPQNPNFVRNVVQVFLQETAKQFTEIEAAWKSQDLTVVQRTSHSMKSTFASFGAEVASNVAKEIENQARDKETKNFEENMTKLKAEFTKLETLLKSKGY